MFQFRRMAKAIYYVSRSIARFVARMEAIKIYMSAPRTSHLPANCHYRSWTKF